MPDCAGADASGVLNEDQTQGYFDAVPRPMGDGERLLGSGCVEFRAWTELHSMPDCQRPDFSGVLRKEHHDRVDFEG